MAKLSRKLGATSQILQVFIQDSSSTTGAGLTGLAFGTSGLTAYYHRDTDTTATSISLVTMTTGTFASGGFTEVNSTHMPGVYQFCPPNAAMATGASSVVVMLMGAPNMAPLPLEIDLLSQVDVESFGGTAGTFAGGKAAATLAATDVTGNIAADLQTIKTQAVVASAAVTFPGSIGTSTLTQAQVSGYAGPILTDNSTGLVTANAAKIGGTAQTGRDLGASVLLSSGTGSGEISLSSGAVLLQATQTGVTIPTVTTVANLTTYTGNTPQTGDSFARIGATGSALTSLFSAANGTTLQNSVNNLNNLSALANLFGPTAMEIPASGSIAYSCQLLVKDAEGHQIDLTASPTVTAANTAGTDRSANLSSVMHVATGQYSWSYAVQSTAAQEGIVITATGTTVAPDSTSRVAILSAAVVSVDTVAALAAIEAQTNKIGTNAGDSPNAVTAQGTIGTNLNATVGSRMATYVQPTGFLAATFPGTVASPTNITGGTITDLANAPTSGDFTAAMKTSLSAATPVATLADGSIKLATFAAGAIGTGVIAGTQTYTHAGSTASIAAGGIVAASFGVAAITSTVAPNLDAAVSTRAAPGAQMDLIDAPNATALAAIVAKLYATATDGTITFQQAMMAILAACNGQSNGFLGSSAVSGAHFLDPSGTKDRITVNCDVNGNRTNVTNNFT